MLDIERVLLEEGVESIDELMVMYKYYLLMAKMNKREQLPRVSEVIEKSIIKWQSKVDGLNDYIHHAMKGYDDNGFCTSVKE